MEQARNMVWPKCIWTFEKVTTERVVVRNLLLISIILNFKLCDQFCWQSHACICTQQSTTKCRSHREFRTPLDPQSVSEIIAKTNKTYIKSLWRWSPYHDVDARCMARGGPKNVRFDDVYEVPHDAVAIVENEIVGVRPSWIWPLPPLIPAPSLALPHQGQPFHLSNSYLLSGHRGALTGAW